MIKKNYDRHLWEAEVCATQEELDDFFRVHQIGEKIIKAVHVIGMAENMERRMFIQQRRLWIFTGAL